MMTRVLLVDDHPMLRDGVRQALAREPDLQVVGEASTAAAALQQAVETAPDLVIMDIHLPDVDGIQTTRRLLERLPTVKVVVFSGDTSRTLVDEALQAGACAYIWKQSAAQELLRAIEMVMAGRLYLSPEVSAGILEDYRRGLAADGGPVKPLLSERDKELLRLIVQGRRNKEIATHLGLSPKSIEACRSRMMKKLGCASTAELVRYAIREGLATA